MVRALIAMVLCIAYVGAAAADEITFYRHTRSYAQLSLGAAFPDDLDFAVSHPLISASGSVGLDPGFAGALTVGYYFADWVAFEAEVGYFNASMTDVSGSGALTGPPLTPFAGSVPIDGDIHAFPAYVNIMLRPDVDPGFFPYVGAGVGGVWWETDLDSVLGFPVNLSEEDSAFSAHFDAGVEFDVGSNMLVGFRYRYTWVDSGDWLFDDFTSHAAFATIRMPY